MTRTQRIAIWVATFIGLLVAWRVFGQGFGSFNHDLPYLVPFHTSTTCTNYLPYTRAETSPLGNELGLGSAFWGQYGATEIQAGSKWGITNIEIWGKKTGVGAGMATLYITEWSNTWSTIATSVSVDTSTWTTSYDWRSFAITNNLLCGSNCAIMLYVSGGTLTDDIRWAFTNNTSFYIIREASWPPTNAPALNGELKFRINGTEW